jgi:hypothetical protein
MKGKQHGACPVFRWVSVVISMQSLQGQQLFRGLEPLRVDGKLTQYKLCILSYVRCFARSRTKEFKPVIREFSVLESVECFTVKKIERRAYPKSMGCNILSTADLSFCAHTSVTAQRFPHLFSGHLNRYFMSKYANVQMLYKPERVRFPMGVIGISR